jgi:hypothetical protein
MDTDKTRPHKGDISPPGMLGNGHPTSERIEMMDEYTYPVKLVKAEVYLVVFENGDIKEFGADGLERVLDYKLNSIASTVSVKVGKFEMVEVQWHDDIDINMRGTTTKDYDKYFDGEEQ